MTNHTDSRKNRRANVLGLSASAPAIAAGLIFAATPGTAMAQDAKAGPVSTSSVTGTTDDGETMVVTGFRASLQSATNTKKLASQIVESVTAEDIGKLPDASIGESISRLPGLTSQRLNGRANVISIRGFGPDLGTTLLNGREQTSTGDSRAVEYDQYPSEIINQVVVYKSPTASLIGQGLSGTVDIRTVRPLSTSKRVLSIGARGVYDDLGALNAGSSALGYRVNGTYVDKFANDTLGVSLAASYVDESYQNQLFNAWGYAGSGTAASPSVIGGNRSFVQSTKLKRFGIVGTAQWQPVPQLTFTVDGFYSHFIDDQINRGIELPLGFGGGFNVQPVTNTTVQNGFVTSGTFNNVRGVVRNDPFERRADLYSFGFNSAWEGNDGWKASFDFGYSRTDRNELSIESYSGTGYNGDDAVNPGFPLGTSPADSISFTSGSSGTSFRPTLNYSDPNLIRLTDPLGWGGAQPQVGYYNNRIVNDELQQYRVKVDREISDSFISAVHFGTGYTYRSKSLTPDEAIIRLAGGRTELQIPSQYLLRSTDLGYLGLGPIVSYDPRALLAAGNIYTLVPNLVPDVFQKAYTLKEQLLQTFLQADINQEIGAAKLTGNFGVQAVLTNQSSTGIVFLSATQSTPTRLGADYVDVLPSINLSLEFPGSWIIRFAAAREIQRPRPDDMRVAIGYGYNQTQQVISGSGGNPTLRPFRANAVDLNFEKYWGRGSYVSLQLFYKDIDTFVFPGVFAFDFGIFPPPTNFPAGAPTVGPLTAPINTKGGEIYGAEVSTTALFGTIVPALDGFGFTGGAGYTYSNITNDRGQRQTIPGYSKWTASGTLFFEKWGFNLRGSARYRSGFLGDFSGFGGNLARRNALSETIIDAQVGYDFGKVGPLAGVSVFVQGQNLTDEPFRSVTNPSTPLQVIDNQTFGRRIYFGATLKF